MPGCASHKSKRKEPDMLTAILEILMFLRRIVRWILKFFLIISVLGIITGISHAENNSMVFGSMIIAALSGAGLIFYDRLIDYIAKKKGVEVWLSR